MQKLRSFGSRVMLAGTGLMLAATSFAGSGGPFSGDELDGATAVVNGFLAIGAAVVIALAIYKLGKRGVSRV
jgi:hypothetical protein